MVINLFDLMGFNFNYFNCLKQKIFHKLIQRLGDHGNKFEYAECLSRNIRPSYIFIKAKIYSFRL